jgi:hypothetical protein
VAIKLTGYQEEFIESPSAMKVAVWGRRTGKTETAYRLVEKELSDAPVLVITPTVRMLETFVRNYEGSRLKVKGEGPRSTLNSAVFTYFRQDIPYLDSYGTVIIDEAGAIDNVELETFLNKNRFPRLYVFGTPLSLRGRKDIPTTFEFLSQGRFYSSISSSLRYGHFTSHVTAFECPFAGPYLLKNTQELAREYLISQYLARFVDRS